MVSRALKVLIDVGADRLARIFPGQRSWTHLSVALLGLMWVIPMLNPHHAFPIPSFYGEWAAALLGLLAMAWLAQHRLWSAAVLPGIALLPLGLIILLMLQVPTDRVAFPEQSFLASAYLIWAFFLMLLGAQLRRELGLAELCRRLATFLFFGGVLNVFMGLLQVYKLNNVFGPGIIGINSTATGNLSQSNHFADYVSLGLASLLYLYVSGRVRKAFLIVAGFLFLWVLSYSGSRSTWLYLLVILLASGVMALRGERATGKKLLLVTLGMMVVFYVIQVYSGPLSNYIASLSGTRTAAYQLPNERLFNIANGVTSRTDVWKESLLMFRDAPLLGKGFAQFAWQHFQLVLQELPPGQTMLLYSHAHNVFFQLLAELGVFSVLLLVGLGSWWLVNFLRGGFPAEKFWLLCLVGILGSHSMLEYPLWYAFFLGVAAVALGVGDERGFVLQMQSVGKWMMISVVALGTVTLGNLVSHYSEIEFMIHRQLFPKYRYMKEQEYAEAIERELLKIHKGSLISPYVEFVYSRAISPLDKDMPEEKLALNTRVMRFAPTEANVYRQAFLLARTGRKAEAQQQFDLAARAYPNDLPPRMAELRRFATAKPELFGDLLRHAESRFPAVSGKP